MECAWGFGGFGMEGGGPPPKPRKTSGRAPARNGETGEPPGAPMAEKPEDLPARPRNGETGGFPGQPRSGETGENSNVAADDNVALEHQAIASLLARMQGV